MTKLDVDNSYMDNENSVSDNNKRIAKNTLYLYLRMFVTLVVGLFTSRITLNALGIHDYGLLSVVAGVITMLDYVNNLLSLGSSRFLTAALGRGNLVELKKTFSACVTLHFMIALATLLFGETIGLWFVNNKLVIEPDRMFAANCVYQMSLFSCFLSIMQTPYSASVVSHEKMSVFAYMSIFDVVTKLTAVSLLIFVNFDKLILYQSFYFFIGVLNIVFYRIYCIKKFEECTFQFGFDKELYKEIWNYVGWNTIGSFAFMMNGQGMTIMLNMFFGTVVNAARGIAFTVNEYIQKFVYGFQMAVAPQVIKYCAQGRYVEMNRLVLNNAKYSSYLVLFLSLPIFLETPYVIYLWLGQVPEYVVPFIRLTFIQMIIRSVDSPVGRGIHAYGRMKLPNISSSFVYMIILPICYGFIYLGASPVVVYVVSIFVFPLALICDLWILNKYTGFNILFFVKEAVLKLILIIALSSLLPMFLHFCISYGLVRFLGVSILSLLSSGIVIFYVGLSKSMQHILVCKVKNKLSVFYRKNG